MTTTTKAIIALTVLNILFFVYAYGIFFQNPVFEAYPLTVQHILEPIFYGLIFVIGNYYIFKTVYFRKKRSDQKNNEQSLLVPTFFLLSFSIIAQGKTLSSIFFDRI